MVENLQRWGNNIIVVTKDDLSSNDFQKLKRVVFASCDIALAASGTVSLELASTETPMVIAYDMGFLSRLVFRLLVSVKSVNLVNLISNSILFQNLLAAIVSLIRFFKPCKSARRSDWSKNSNAKIFRPFERWWGKFRHCSRKICYRFFGMHKT